MKRYAIFILAAIVSIGIQVYSVCAAEAAFGDFLSKWTAYRISGNVAADGLGSIYVTDTYSHRIRVYSEDGSFITQWGAYGKGDGQFMYPDGISVDRNGNLYVTDANNHRIQVFSADGTYITKWGEYGAGDGQFHYPGGIAADGRGRVYVADTNNHRIQVFSEEGTYITKWGEYGAGDSQFHYPGGIAADGRGRVYVADANNHRIQVFSEEGDFLSTWGSYGYGDSQLIFPSGIASYTCGDIYVANMSHSYNVKIFEGFRGDLAAEAGPDQGVEQTSPAGATVALDGSGSFDECGAELSFAWIWEGGSASGVTPAVSLPAGQTTVTLAVTNGSSSKTDTVQITIRDTTPPAVSCPNPLTVPINILRDEQLIAEFLSGAAAVDLVDSDVAVMNDAPPVFSKAGPHIVTFTASDDSLNRSSCSSVVFVTYGFEFDPPISLGKSFKLGSTVPVKFHLTDAYGKRILGGKATLMLRQYRDGMPAGDEILPIPSHGSGAGNSFRPYGEYIFNLNTAVLSAGTWELTVTLEDGSRHSTFLTLIQ